MKFDTISYTGYRSYSECPKKWWYRHVENVPDEERSYFSFGKTVHGALEQFVQPLLPPNTHVPVPELAVLEALYDKNWLRGGYQTPEEEYTYYALGKRILADFHRDWLLKRPVPLLLERWFDVSADGYRLHGFIDRIDLTEKDGLHILDYKTSKKAENAVESDQLGVYQYATEKLLTPPVEALSLVNLRTMGYSTSPPRSATQLADLKARVGEVVDRIRHEQFDPRPAWHCRFCPYRSLCPVGGRQ